MKLGKTDAAKLSYKSDRAARAVTAKLPKNGEQTKPRTRLSAKDHRHMPPGGHN